jgi:hypothetical protein
MIGLLILAAMPYELVVSWPNRPAVYQHTYASAEACERGRAVVLADNARKIAEAQAKVGTVVPGMGTVVSASPPPLPTALCLPN